MSAPRHFTITHEKLDMPSYFPRPGFRNRSGSGSSTSSSASSTYSADVEIPATMGVCEQPRPQSPPNSQRGESEDESTDWAAPRIEVLFQKAAREAGLNFLHSRVRSGSWSGKGGRGGREEEEDMSTWVEMADLQR